MNRIALGSLVLLLVFGGCAAKDVETAGEIIGEGASAVVDSAAAVGEAAVDTVTDVTADDTAAETRAKIDETAAATIARLLSESAAAKKLYGVSYGYAVFDTRKLSIMITTGFGSGVAVEKPSKQRTYMRMATGGINLGVGGQLFQLVILFENRESFRRFVDEGWEAGAEANATFGEMTAAVTPRFVEGMAVYQLTEAGVMLDINFTGTKYWKYDELNNPS